MTFSYSCNKQTGVKTWPDNKTCGRCYKALYLADFDPNAQPAMSTIWYLVLSKIRLESMKCMFLLLRLPLAAYETCDAPQGPLCENMT